MSPAAFHTSCTAHIVLEGIHREEIRYVVRPSERQGVATRLKCLTVKSFVFFRCLA